MKQYGIMQISILNCSKQLCFLPHLQVLQIWSSIMDSICKLLFLPLLSGRNQWHQESDTENISVPGLEDSVSEGECWWLVTHSTSFHLFATQTGFHPAALWSWGGLSLPARHWWRHVFRRLLLYYIRFHISTTEDIDLFIKKGWKIPIQ